MGMDRQTGLNQPPNFYRDNYQAVILLVIIAIFTLIGMVIFVLHQIFHRPLPVFVAAGPNGQKMQLVAFDEPNYLPNTLLTWASKAAVAAYTFDFVNYNKQIALARPYFTASGWGDYQGSVQGLIADITKKQLFVNGVVSGSPVISNQGPLPGKGYVWRIQMPFLVTYQSAEAISKQNFLVIMTIVKVPTAVDPTGIGIDQFVMR